MKEVKENTAICNMIDFFITNLNVLHDLRPDVEIYYNEDGRQLYEPEIKLSGMPDFEAYKDKLQAINTSIILNCFALFEACFEAKILHQLNISSLNGIQKKVMLRYINQVIKISSIKNYSDEFKFVFGKSIKDYFTHEEYKSYQLIDDFYVVRNILIHGSAQINKIQSEPYSFKIMLGDDKNNYSKLINKLIQEHNIRISFTHTTLSKLILVNEAVKLLVKATATISYKFTIDIPYEFKELYS